MDEPAEKINVKVNNSKSKPSLDAAAVTGEPLDSAMTEAVNAIEISDDGKLTNVPEKPRAEPAKEAESAKEQGPKEAASPEPEGKASALSSADKLPKFGVLQPKIDEHPLFSGVKEPAAKKSGKKSLLKRTFAPLVTLLLVVVVGYLLIDSGVVKGASHLPFHVFKQPVVATTPAITPPVSTTSTSDNTLTNDKIKAAAAADTDVATWKSVTSGKKGFSLKVPNGWDFSNWTSTDYLYATDYSDLAYKAGAAPTITTGDTFAVDGGVIRHFAIEGDPIAQKDTIGYYYDDQPQSFTTSANLVGQKYMHVFSTDGDGYKKGDILYQYRFEGKKSLITVHYYVLGSETDQSLIVEQALKTLSYQ